MRLDDQLDRDEERVRRVAAAMRAPLERALERDLASKSDVARRRVEAAAQTLYRSGDAPIGSSINRAVARALRSRFRKAGLPPSRHLIMPGGGRSFHFEHVSIRPDPIALKKGHRIASSTRLPSWSYARDITWKSRPSAHQRYIARDEAIEMASPAAAQRYMVDPLKIATEGNGSGPEAESSFGTPGLSISDMCEMWDLAERYPERKKNAVLQHRMIVELPHQATPADRIAIMREFVAPLVKAGVPFWVSIHSPTADNDDRNYHAHVVFLNRGARKIPWPEGGDVGPGSGPPVMTWDFAAVSRIKDEHRKVRERFPKRQRVPPLLEGTWIKSWRWRFADIVNARMSKSNSFVRFDPRSYQNAGIVDAVPEKKAGYGRKVAARVEPSLDEIIRDLARTSLGEADAEQSEQHHKLAKAKASATAGGDAYIALLNELRVLDESADTEKLARAKSRSSRQLAIGYFAAEKALADIRVAAIAERRGLEKLIEATSEDALADARARLNADVKSRPSATRDRSRAALSELPDRALALELRTDANAELLKLTDRHSRQQADAAAIAAMASEAWLNSLEPKDITMTHEINSPVRSGQNTVAASVPSERTDTPASSRAAAPASSPPTPPTFANAAGKEAPSTSNRDGHSGVHAPELKHPATVSGAPQPQTPPTNIAKPAVLSRGDILFRELLEKKGRRIDQTAVTTPQLRKLLPDDDEGAARDARHAELYGEMTPQERAAETARRRASLLAGKIKNNRSRNDRSR